jgi:hypothetical protein
MCLVYSPESRTVLSISREKITCHEGMYAHFDPTASPAPNTNITTIDTTHEPTDPNPNQNVDDKVKGVHSIKVIRDSQISKEMLEPLPNPPPEFLQPPNPGNQGENLYHGEQVLDEDSLLEAIRKIKDKAKTNGESQYLQIVEALKKDRHEKDSSFKQKKGYGADFNSKINLNERRSLREKKRKAEIQIGNKVKIRTIRFGKQNSPKHTVPKKKSITGIRVTGYHVRGLRG